MTEYVVVYAFNVDIGPRRIPMILKDKPAHLKGFLNLPGGKLNEGEDPIDAAIRELKEETGLDDLSVSDGMCPISPELMGQLRFKDCLIHCVKVPVIYDELNPQEGETEPVAWFNVHDVMKDSRLIPNLTLIIPLMDFGVKGWVLNDYNGTASPYLDCHLQSPHRSKR
jgi:8-oxo-dGTP pyrophosphatase MutT (NUDIX family)